MGWLLHPAVGAQALVDGLAEQLHSSRDLLDPFSPVIVAVPARGVERWLQQRLSHRLGAGPGRADGVSAGIEMPSPTRVLDGLLAELVELDVDGDPWRPAALPWRLLAVVEAAGDQAWAAPLVEHFGLGAEQPEAPVGPRLALARRIADRFSRYLRDRPQLMLDWAAGQDTDGIGGELPPEQHWQPQLWRALVAGESVPDPATRARTATERLRAEPDAVTLPDELHLFGPTRLAALDLALLDAVAERRAVHLWLPYPSPAQWSALAAARPSPGSRRSDSSAGLVPNLLLRSLGRDSRELQERLLTRVENTPACSGAELSEPPGSPEPPGNALQVLQRSLRQADPAPHEPARLAGEDRSVQVHACHGRGRQVEVVRDVITGLLQNDPTLQPRDIIVMCPDVETFAPLVLGAFGNPTPATGSGAVATHPGRSLRVKLADRSLRQTNPVLAAVWRTLELLGGRMTATDVLDLAAMEAVSRRFRFDESDFEKLRRWTQESDIRWGLTAPDRAQYGLEGIIDGTWHRGLDRWLSGMAQTTTDFDFSQSGLPLDQIESMDADLIGHFVELIHRLAGLTRRAVGAHPVEHWLDLLGDLLDQLTLAPADQAWQRVQVDRLLARARQDSAGARTTMRREDILDLFAEAVAARPTSSSFRTGDLTVCSMVPMRFVPHRVVIVLGLDDGALPRDPGLDGDDVLALDPQVGERDIAAEDRQLFLDAILSASERLVLCYTGADERTGATLPPAVPLGEVLDDLNRRVVGPAGESATDLLVHRHPLQPFDPRNFTEPTTGGSFDPIGYAGALALQQPRGPRRVLVDAVLPAPPQVDELELDQLIRFFNDPCQYYLRNRLGVELRDFIDDLEVRLPIDADGLARHHIGSTMLEHRLSGASAHDAKVAAYRRGDLPAGNLRDDVLNPVAGMVETICAEAAPWLAPPATALGVDAVLGDGVRLRGSVGGVHGSAIVSVQYASLKAKNQLRAWLELLAVAATEQRAGVVPVERAVVVAGKGRKFVLRAPPAQEARRLLDFYRGCFEAGQREPLPLPPSTAEKYARARRNSARDPWWGAARAWSGEFGENRGQAYPLTIGTTDQQLLRRRQGSDLTWPPTAHGETSWFGTLAVAVFGPMLQYEEA